MDLPIVDFFEHWFSKKSHNTNLFVALIVGGIVLLLLATLLSFALASPDDLFDQDELSFFESSAQGWFSRHCLVPFLLLGVTIYVLFAIMRLEFLSSHIGEKRLVDSNNAFLNKFSFSRSFPRTAFLYRAVFFMCSARLLALVSTPYPVFVRDRFS